jgi:hypothetical protein
MMLFASHSGSVPIRISMENGWADHWQQRWSGDNGDKLPGTGQKRPRLRHG